MYWLGCVRVSPRLCQWRVKTNVIYFTLGLKVEWTALVLSLPNFWCLRAVPAATQLIQHHSVNGFIFKGEVREEEAVRAPGLQGVRGITWWKSKGTQRNHSSAEEEQLSAHPPRAIPLVAHRKQQRAGEESFPSGGSSFSFGVCDCLAWKQMMGLSHWLSKECHCWRWSMKNFSFKDVSIWN